MRTQCGECQSDLAPQAIATSRLTGESTHNDDPRNRQSLATEEDTKWQRGGQSFPDCCPNNEEVKRESASLN